MNLTDILRMMLGHGVREPFI